MALKPFAISAVEMGKSQYLTGGRLIVRLSLQVDNSLALRKIESFPLGWILGERKRGAKEVTKQRKANSLILKVTAFVSHSFSYCCVINTSMNLVSCPDARDVF